MSAINNYVRSGGKTMPLDWENYINNKLCVFCRRPHSSNVVFIYKDNAVTTEMELRVNSKTHCCDSCQLRVDVMLSLQDTEIDEQTIRRKKDLKSLIFDSDINDFIDHLEEEKDEWIQKNTNCYVCRKPLGDLLITTVNVPTVHSAYINGGFIKIHRECCTVNIDSATTFMQFYRMNCTNCGIEYYIDDSEFQYRLEKRITDSCMCPICAYHTVNDIPKAHPYYIDTNYPPRTSKMVRFKSVPCHFCNETFEIDLTLGYGTMLKTYYTFTNILTCPKCKQLRKGFLSPSCIVVRYSDVICAIIVPVENDQYTFTIIQLNKDYKTINSTVRYNDIMEAVFTAYEEMSSL